MEGGGGWKVEGGSQSGFIWPELATFPWPLECDLKVSVPDEPPCGDTVVLAVALGASPPTAGSLARLQVMPRSESFFPACPSSALPGWRAESSSPRHTDLGVTSSLDPGGW